MVYKWTNRMLIKLFGLIILQAFIYAPNSVEAAKLQSEEIFFEDFSDGEEFKNEFSFAYSLGDNLELDRYKNFYWQYNINEALLLNSNKRIKFDDKFYYYPSTAVAAQGSNCFSLTEFDIYIEKNTVFEPRYDIFLSSTYSPGRYFGVVRVAGSKIYVVGNDTVDDEGSTVLGFSEPIEVKDGAWHHISILMRCTDENAGACAVFSSVAVDGAVVYSTTEERNLSNYKSKLRYYDMICVQNRKNAPGDYIDNISVKRISDYDVNESISHNGKALYTVRKAADFLHKNAKLKETPSYIRLNNEYNKAVELLEYDENASVSDLEECYDLYGYEKISIESVNYTDGKIKDVTFLNNEADSETNIIISEFLDEELVSCRLFNDIELQNGLSTVKLDEPFCADMEDIKMFVWDGCQRPKAQVVEVKDLEQALDIKFNGDLYFTDTPAYVKADGTVYVPAENVLNLLGASMQKCSKVLYHAERIDGEEIDFIVDSTQMYEGVLPMIDMEKVCEAFDCTYSVDYENKILFISSDYSEEINAREPRAGEIEYFYSGYGSFCFKINCDSEAEVEAFVRVDQSHVSEVLKLSDVTKENYIGWSMPLESMILWKEAYNLTYRDGGYEGSFSGIRPNGKYYDVMFKITHKGKTETVLDKRAILLPNTYSSLEEAKYPAKTLSLLATFENISYYLDSDDVGSAEIYYKKETEKEWNKGFTPVYNENTGQYMGSITKLESDTVYDVKLVVNGKESVSKTATWDENPDCREILLSEIYTEGTLVLQGIKGKEDEWIKIIGDVPIAGTENNWEAVYISDCKNMILENLTITGGKRYGISISGGSENIRISNCDISEWGREGVWNDISHTYRLNFDAVNYDGAISLVDADNVVIERCFIHDCNAKTNTWHSDDYTQVHPSGGSAIYSYMGKGLVVRYNDFIGNNFNRWNDAIEGAYNSSYHAGIGFDADIYGNMFFGGNDDAVELDGGSMNVRIYRNRIEQFYCGISFAPIKIGPVYAFENLLYNLGDTENNSYTPMKQSNSDDEIAGVQFWFNNTILARRNARMLNSVAYNNIITSDTSVYPIPMNRSGDYNFLFGKVSSYSFAENEIHGISPGFEDFKAGRFNLTDTSTAKGSGIMLNNFMNTETPDMGAFAEVDNIPYRPIELSSDKNHLMMKDKTEATFVIRTGELESGLSYSVKKSNADTWLGLSGDISGTAESNREYRITVKTDMDAYDASEESLQGAVSFRLSNGYSIPITVKCDK